MDEIRIKINKHLAKCLQKEIQGSQAGSNKDEILDINFLINKSHLMRSGQTNSKKRLL